MSDLKASAICPTYGRALSHLHLLEECVYWFTQQTYDNKELIILNDCPGQVLICPVKNVKVFNYKTRFETLGEKYDELVRLSSGDIILPWEDDDISLPHRISQAVEKLKVNLYFNPQHTWYEESGTLHNDHKHGVCHNASAYRKNFWTILGGYGTKTGDQDSYFDIEAKKKSFSKGLAIPNYKDWSYVYRWGVSNIHLSGNTDMQKSYTNNKNSQDGTFVILPKMIKDYVSEVNKF